MSGSQPTNPPSTEGSIWQLLQWLGSNYKSPQDQEQEAFHRRLDAIEHHLSQPVNMRLERGDDGLISGAVASYPTPADAYEFNAPVVKQSVADAIATAQKPEFWKDAANQYANALVAGTSTPGFRAFHGSPYDFDKFDMGKIGTGEGAQAYGHGLYFAGNEGVARSYRDQLTRNSGSVSYRTPTRDSRIDNSRHTSERFLADRFRQTGGNLEATLGMLRKDLSENPGDKTVLEAIRLAENPDSNISMENINPGHMYEVNIAADLEHFLDWDKPLSEQSPHVINALNKAGFDLSYNPRTAAYGRERTGGELVKASKPEDIHSTGLPGIRYLDAQSRNAGGWHITPPNETVSGKWMVKSSDYNSTGEHYDTEAEAKVALEKKIAGQTSNYVVFKPEIIEILRKYGLLGMLGGGAAGSAFNGRGEDQE